MSTRTCPTCEGPVIEIEIAAGATPLVMRSCSHCDAREWSAAGQGIDLTAALAELSTSDGGRRSRP